MLLLYSFIIIIENLTLDTNDNQISLIFVRYSSFHKKTVNPFIFRLPWW